jgi:Putative Ig domain
MRWIGLTSTLALALVLGSGASAGAGAASAPAAPAFAAANLPSVMVGVPYTYSFVASGNPAPIFVLASGALPSGLVLNATTGQLTGTPTAPGPFTFSIGATNGVAPNAVTGLITMTVAPPFTAPAFNAATPPASAAVGVAYSYGVTATGNPAPRFTLASGTLPAGLTLNASSGALAGTPATSGSFTFALRASNGVLPDAVSGSVTILVAPMAAAAALMGASPPSTAVVGSSYDYIFGLSGSPAPELRLGSGSLPPGLGLTASGSLTGVPSASGTFTFTVQATNGIGSPAVSRSLTITVAPGPRKATPTKPANKIQFTAVKAGRSGVISLRLAVPAAGRLAVRTYARVRSTAGAATKTIKYAPLTAATSRAKAAVSISITPSHLAINALRRAKKLRVGVSVTFAPTGGAKHTQSTAVTARTP